MLPQVMRLRRAVPKIPPKSPFPHWLPLYKNHLSLTHAESTLPQVLIPLHFNSRRIRVYKKNGGGVPPLYPKVLELVTTAASSMRARTGTPQTQSPLRFTSRISVYPGGGGHTSARSSFFAYFDFRISSQPFAALLGSDGVTSNAVASGGSLALDIIHRLRGGSGAVAGVEDDGGGEDAADGEG